MLDAFAKVVSQADARGEYISDSQLDALSAMVADSNKRIDTVNRITGNSSTIVANAARALFAEQGQLIAPWRQRLHQPSHGGLPARHGNHPALCHLRHLHRRCQRLG